MKDNDLTPKDITKDRDTGIETASFGYYDGIDFARERNLEQSTSFSDVNKGTHFIVCCGDVMLKVKETDFPDTPRRML